MNIEPVKEVGGYPEVSWRQEVPGGDTVASAARGTQLGYAVLIGAVFSIVVFICGGGWVWAAVLGLLLAGMIAAPGPFRVGIKEFALWGEGVPQETEGERRERQKRALTPVYVMEFCRARVERSGSGLRLCVWRGREKSAMTLGETLPLDSFSELVLGTKDEWFGDVAEREMVKLEQATGEWVIVALAEGRGAVVIARSGRDKSGMARLHEVLTREFIGHRREWALRDG